MIAAASPPSITTLAQHWRAALDGLGVESQVVASGVLFQFDVTGPGLWLRRSRQLLIVRDELDPWAVFALLRLYDALPPRLHLADETGDVRVLIGLPGGALLGVCGGFVPHDRPTWCEQITLFQCARCTGWWATGAPTPSGCGCTGCGHGGEAARWIPSPLGPFPQAPAAQPAKRCPPRRWVGVRRAS